MDKNEIGGVMVLKRIFLGIIIGMISLTAIGCSEEKTVSPEQAVKDVVQANIKALNEENVEDYMKSIDLNSEALEATKEAVVEMFEKYDLKTEITELKVYNITDTTADVEITQTTKKIKGPEYTDSMSTIVHHMKKVDGEWKFNSSEIIKTEHLNN